MSASERLAALAVTHERVLPIFRRVGPEDWKRDRPTESVMDALPEIVAVIEGAENLPEFFQTPDGRTHSFVPLLDALNKALS